MRALEGLLVAGFLGCWFISHPLLHSEMTQPEWRAVVLPRVMGAAPYLMATPVMVALAAGMIRYRRGSDGDDRPPAWWRAIGHVVFLISFFWIAQVLLLWWYAALLRVG